jgi:hypothetical protein
MAKIGGGIFKSFLGIGLFIFSAAFLSAADKASLVKTAFAPADPPRTLLTVKERGYYSVQTKSKTGTALELVDRMAGVIGTLSGAPGERDGRIDLLLETGQYRVNLFPDRAVTTPAELAVVPYREANPGATPADYPFIYDGETQKTFLSDLETRSFWIYLPERGELRLEAMGRNLKSCALWQNGQWLMSAQPAYAEREPVKGRPMLFAEFHQPLEAGHYLLVCVGGPKRAWAEEADDNSLYLRRGARFLGSNGLQKLHVSPFGRDAYLIAGSADYVECVRDTLAQTRLTLGTYAVGASRYANSSSAEINKQSKEPWCRIQSRNTTEKKWLVVEATPGDLLEVSFFKRGGANTLPYDKKEAHSYWVSTVSGYAARNLIDLTPLVYTRYDRRFSFLKEGAARVSAAAPFIRKVNLLGANTVYLFVEEPGAYRIAEDSATGGKAKYRFTLLEDRFLGTASGEYKTPDKAFELVKGFWALDLQATSLGILHLALYKDGSQKADELLKRAPGDPRYAVAWPRIDVAADTTASLAVNARYDLALGVDIRELPLSLAVPLAVALAPGAQAEFSATVENESLLMVEGDKYALTVSGKKTENESTLLPGTYTVGIKNESKETDLITLTAVEKLSLQRIPKPVLASFDTIFPVFTEDKAYFADFDRGQTRNVLLRVSEPSLYRIETSGRLALGLAVRTPTVPSLVHAEENSDGRNALIQTYLKPGDYLVSVTTRGLTRGRAGVSLQKTPFADKGALNPGDTSRQTVEADVGLRYALAADVKARYTIGTAGLGVEFPFRVEDSEGFPLQTGKNGATLELETGDYAYYSLPMAFLSRRLTSFAKIVEPAPPVPGAKRFELALNQTMENEWLETAGRAPDVFAFALAAPLNVVVSLSRGMAGTLSGKSLAKPIDLADGQSQTLELSAGSFEIAVRAREEQNLFPYSLSVGTDTLAAGLGYLVDPEERTFSVSTAGDSVYEFASAGISDVKASLWDETGARLIAANDDMENDWNFRITQRLPAGRWLLRVEPAGRAENEIYVSMTVSPENRLDEKKLPFTVEQTLGREILKLPVRPETEGLFAVKAETGRAVKLALYRDSELLAEGDGFLAVPLFQGRAYTLQIWQRDDRPQKVKVTASFAAPKELTLATQTGMIDCPAFLVVNNPAGLSYRLVAPAGAVLYSSGRETPCLAPGDWIATAPGERGWLVLPAGGTVKGLRFEPAALANNQKETAFLSGIPESFLCDPGAADVWLLTATGRDRACGLALSPRASYKNSEFDFRGLDVSGTTTFLLLPPIGAYQGKIWNLEARLPGQSDARADLLLTRFPAQGGKLAKGETKTWRLAPGKGLRLDLDAGPQKIRLLLAQNTAAAVWKDNRPQAMAVADAENRDIEFTVDGGTLALANYGDRDAVVKATVGESALAPVISLSADGFEAAFDNPGRYRLSVPAGHEKESLCLSGEGFSARFMAGNGRLTAIDAPDDPSGVTVIAAGSGDLDIVCERGWVRVNFAPPGRENEGLIARPSGLAAKPLAGGQPLQGREGLYSFSLDTDAFAVVTATAPGLLALYGDNKLLAVRSGIGNAGPSMVYRLSRGKYEVYARAIRGATLSGTLSLARVTPVLLSGKNDEKDFFIGQGEVQVFRFDVTEAGSVGIGLSAEADRLRAELYGADSELVGMGSLLIRSLEKGSYYLVVYGGERPVRYAPVIYGQAGGLAGVPQEIIDQYQNPKTATQVEEEGGE